MLQLTFIRENKELTIKGLERKYFKNAAEVVDSVIEIDDNRRNTQKELDDALAKGNQLAKQIGGLMKEGKKEEAEKAKSQTAELKEKSKALEEKLKELENSLQEIMVTIPNLPHESVPEGRTPEENLNIFEAGTIPSLHANAQPHWELIKKYDIIDFELGNKVSGAGFPFYKGKGAKIQRALINFFLNEAEAAGYFEVQPPIVINAASGFGTGQLPDKEGQMYYAAADDLYLIPTAEVPVTNIYRDVILSDAELPAKNVAYTPCFRREAGSWGAHVRGLNRLHQFDKVEIVQIRKPEESYQALEEMLEHVKGLLQKLNLPFRILRLCGGDMSFTSALTFDFEVFSAAQERWLEVSSVSNFESYQANRLKLRYKIDGKTRLLHTLNGSALALPRILAAILENNQTPEGIKVPDVLVPFCGFDIIN
ncbi:MAG: serine--tRNA ligase [Cytophagaceae bacterium]|nr:serine--tRNA ligase [Cytophagaceae bacterium]MBL0302191.1 serine--tRNA ligase [Cytophagaceae bacterium]MBL0325017.1 serine--tRNA ligase [Cytophagaceae bacterium]